MWNTLIKSTGSLTKQQDTRSNYQEEVYGPTIKRKSTASRTQYNKLLVANPAKGERKVRLENLVTDFLIVRTSCRHVKKYIFLAFLYLFILETLFLL
jgi:hypothetical protein